ncbi:GH32 C-terminal domain-containing protein [Jeotgalibacillus sp. JSM ZJ347]|uniref:GH32 C-terminal domain-containing protein n=1 Tax=Jeotgalibacillus sp. JSM ZJ347 TaxID=3342117 RepID=UPI0035A985FC
MALIYSLTFNEGNGSQVTENVRSSILDVHYIFNQAVYKENCAPRWTGSEKRGYSLDFDGYSTFIEDEPVQPGDTFTLSALIAPRCFEACHGGVSTAIMDQLDRELNRGFSLSLYQHGEVQFEIGDGKKIHQFRTEHQLELFRKSLITAVYDHQQVRLYINGSLACSALLQHSFVSSACTLSIGRNRYPFSIGPYFKGGMFSGLIDEIRIDQAALTGEEVLDEFNSLTNRFTVSQQEVDLDETRLLDDPHRPKYHAIPPQHWMNEPHAPFYFNGKYHLFYQKNASGPYFSNLHWGHWTSDDMVFWKNEKTALFPIRGSLTPSGVWSGSAVIGPDHLPYLFYTAADFSKTYNQGVGIATPADPDDPHLSEWKMHDQIAISQTERQGIKAQFRDPFVWKDSKENLWYLIIGGGIMDKGPTAWAYTSENCVDWSFKGEFFTVDIERFPSLGTNWELPVFLPLTDADGKTKHILIFMSYFDHESHEHVDTYYYIGEFDRDSVRFIPDHEEPRLMDYGRFKFSGPSGFVDPVTGKSIVFSILQGDRSEKEEYDAGWAHNAGLPIELSHEEGDLRIKPLQALTSLRKEKLLDLTHTSIKDVNRLLRPLCEKMLEVIIEFSETDQPVGLMMKKSKDGREKTSLIYQPAAQQVWLDRTESSLNRQGDLQGGRLDINGNPFLHVYIDHSAIECYLNQRQMISSRAYPALKNSDHLSIIGPEHTMIKSIKIYQLTSIWQHGEMSDQHGNEHKINEYFIQAQLSSNAVSGLDE